MKIVVCVKQVPDTNEVRIDPVKGTLIREGVPAILNPDDANALEQALRLKDQYENVKVTVLTMGIPSSSYMLRECLAMGADEAILVTDRAFAGADTWATSNALASALRKVGDYDLIFAGRQAIDGDTAQVGPQIAERLNIPQVTYVMGFDYNKDKNTLIVDRQLEDGYERVQIKSMPALITAINELNEPRYMTVGGIVDAYKKDIKIFTIKDLDVTPDEVGLNASPTSVFRSFAPDKKQQGVMLNGTPEEMVGKLVTELQSKHYI
ncbi:electron transfer flavoprotein subunit beta/FixA family protein [Clostridium niameyense]|uniref:Electron transfer flavoprotein small subunit n=1 Tax=Clostridium niameyense TaxID=1622073 RepID=A0A6M0R986_9CLOT|nr:electron transfer flavoprotein subunit beta [Clostridium niameyense]NEZ46811.1 electron transfer flavoprotein subunit beta/FixA family protein [Clostridium niameyense]